MPPPARIPDALKRVFVETFTARDIAEPLASFDAEARSTDVRSFMNDHDYDLVGIRREGRSVGYVRRDSLNGDLCGQHATPFDDGTLLDDTTPLIKVILELNRSPVVFLKVLGSVVGIVTKDDLQKAPVRMWLFGLLTLIEMRFSELIEQHCPDETWKRYLSPARLNMAEYLLADRRQRIPSIRLLDCLQLADKGTIVSRDTTIRQFTIFSSRRNAQDTIKTLERLRNNLAHAQDIIASDWETIVSLSEFVMHQLDPSPEWPGLDEARRAGPVALDAAEAVTSPDDSTPDTEVSEESCREPS